MSVAGAVALAIWQGVGSGLVDWLVRKDDSQASASTQPTGAPGGEPRNATGEGATPAPAPGIVRARIPIAASAVGVAPTEARACVIAVQNLTRQVENQCDRMVIEQRGTSRRVDAGDIECQTCGVTSGRWRCVAQAAPECVIMGEANSETDE